MVEWLHGIVGLIRQHCWLLGLDYIWNRHIESIYIFPNRANSSIGWVCGLDQKCQATGVHHVRLSILFSLASRLLHMRYVSERARIRAAQSWAVLLPEEQQYQNGHCWVLQELWQLQEIPSCCNRATSVSDDYFAGGERSSPMSGSPSKHGGSKSSCGSHPQPQPLAWSVPPRPHPVLLAPTGLTIGKYQPTIPLALWCSADWHSPSTGGTYSLGAINVLYKHIYNTQSQLYECIASNKAHRIRPSETIWDLLSQDLPPL